MRNKIYSFALFSISMFAFSCTKENVEELSKGCNSEQATYSSIKQIFENNCVQCHSKDYSNKNIRLDTYEGAKNAASNDLLKAIKHEPGDTPMPYGGNKLSDCEIKSIESWISRNYPQ